MPTINQLVHKKRKDKVRKSKAPVLQVGLNTIKKKTNNVIFFVSIVDSDNSEIMENYSAEQLNSYDKFLTFKNRFQSKP